MNLAMVVVPTTNGVLGIIIAIVGIAGAIAGVAGYYRASYAKARIEALNGDVAELNLRYGLEKSARQEVEQKLTTETTARKVLQDVVTGKQDWTEVTEILRNLDQRLVSVMHVIDSIATATGAAGRPDERT